MKQNYGRKEESNLKYWKIGKLKIKKAIVFCIAEVVNRQPSTVNRQPSTVNRQPSTVNRQPATAYCLLPTAY
jgi:hypothetical protein